MSLLSSAIDWRFTRAASARAGRRRNNRGRCPSWRRARSAKISRPSRIDSGTPTKNTCICGISRASTPSPILNTRPNTRNGADSCMPMRNAPAKVLVISAAASPVGRHSPGRTDRVAVVERGDHQMMHVGREQQRDAEQREEIADQQALLALGRIDRGDEAKPQLLGDDRAGDLQRRNASPARWRRARCRSESPATSITRAGPSDAWSM